MAYSKQLWKDYPDTTTPITADRLNHMEEGIEEASKTGGESDKVGVIKLFGGSNAPDGWLLCDGSAVSRTTYSDLFALIGTAYGEGDGSTTFNIPNIKGKTVVGLDSSDSDFNTLGKTGGEKTHKLTISEMPEHDHNVTKNTNDNLVLMAQAQNKFGDAGTGTGSGWYWNRGVPKQGGGQAHNNLQPYIVLNYIIKVSATTTTQAEVIDSLDGNSTTNAPSVHAVNEGLGNIRGQILWTNPNPMSEFASQTITLNSNNYDYLEFIFKSDYNDSTKAIISGRAIKGYGIRASYTSITSFKFWSRQINYNNETNYNIGDCMVITSSSGSVSNANLIPLYVIGYKTGLFD